MNPIDRLRSKTGCSRMGNAGTIDEVRVSNVVRSPDWVRAQYLSMTDSFIEYGPQEVLSD